MRTVILPTYSYDYDPTYDTIQPCGRVSAVSSDWWSGAISWHTSSGSSGRQLPSTYSTYLLHGPTPSNILSILYTAYITRPGLSVVSSPTHTRGMKIWFVAYFGWARTMVGYTASQSVLIPCKGAVYSRSLGDSLHVRILGEVRSGGM